MMSNRLSFTSLKAGDHIIPIMWVEDINIENIEQGFITITTYKGVEYKSYGFDAIEAVMVFKPSALEGRRLKWKKNAWAFHNFIAHPVVQILAWVGLKRQAVQFHDWTTPTPRGFKDT
jgi:hypothetical protein